ncbi:hypothetical protein [Mycolicibacterium fortuitum]|uniref:PE family protein n=3 Tax=Mycolicibacterium fortuitum TaxID=1766 RepID=A0A0N9YIE7_MYCFO|nr:hypothetical protein [Mycolicibacterium fortuitum]AIY48658.1 hypothetical protein G155_27555 [Mycobacterium sp. VKM Ac-1817D]CRL72150.1 hypothetical protein CPGR_00829 [Mycolicibacter nonchromogenicus]ALI29358.1 hypothetical protein XA26_55680 [Mycolicibacterium fortuitum]AMD55999.1 hypothetical protein ATO49_26190 [Mycolicibacterium fortuitum subsp. fortuitum DSM 46621 = ATCC 6841 = JCM 6387]EJZ09108.1 hypothetical protein MFORT_23207 [Mycolicibacterium fortuitum subsp. fortuitum DSM 46621
MSDIFAAQPTGMAAFSAANEAAGTAITTAGSADSAAMLMSAAAALGPVGAVYLAAFGPAQANNLAGTLLVGGVHAATGAGTEVARSAVLSNDNA